MEAALHGRTEDQNGDGALDSVELQELMEAAQFEVDAEYIAGMLERFGRPGPTGVIGRGVGGVNTV